VGGVLYIEKLERDSPLFLSYSFALVVWSQEERGLSSTHTVGTNHLAFNSLLMGCGKY
jgi:hypothetical protein